MVGLDFVMGVPVALDSGCCSRTFSENIRLRWWAMRRNEKNQKNKFDNLRGIIIEKSPKSDF
jgi:hypothetical protein